MYKAHLVVGGSFLLVFLITGAYMLLSFPELYAGREEIRVMFRATHVYILMSSLLNLMTANYTKWLSVNIEHPIQCLASCLILITPVLFTMAIFVEPAQYMINRPISFWSVIFLLAGVILHTGSQLIKRA